MAKKDKHKQHDGEVPAPSAAGGGRPVKMKRKAYEREMRVLHGELVALQEWVKASGAKICLVFEGPGHRREGRHDQADHRAGQPGGCSGWWRCLAPTEREEVPDVHPAVPAALPGGFYEVVIFDRSWYNRGRRRAGDGVLHGAGDRAVPGAGAAGGDVDGR